MGKFEIGKTLATKGVIELIGYKGCAYLTLLHASGDYGDICESDREINDWSIENGARIVSVYEKLFSEKIYVMTEADRSTTTVLLASEY
jgi:hypothetical protein